jgi:uncharacterized membrane protein
MTYFAITRFLTTPEAIYGVILGLAALLFGLYRLILCICSFLLTSPFLSSRVETKRLLRELMRSFREDGEYFSAPSLHLARFLIIMENY